MHRDLSDDLQADPLVQAIYDFENIFSAALRKRWTCSTHSSLPLWNQKQPCEARLIVAWEGGATGVRPRRRHRHGHPGPCDDLATTNKFRRQVSISQPLLRAEPAHRHDVVDERRRCVLLHCSLRNDAKNTGVLALAMPAGPPTFRRARSCSSSWSLKRSSRKPPSRCRATTVRGSSCRSQSSRCTASSKRPCACVLAAGSRRRRATR